jgi:hypothetical protein
VETGAASCCLFTALSQVLDGSIGQGRHSMHASMELLTESACFILENPLCNLLGILCVKFQYKKVVLFGVN